MGFNLGKALSFGLGSSLLGGDKKETQIDLGDGKVFKPFEIGGASGSIDDGIINIGSSDARTSLVNDLSGTFSNQASDIRGFLPKIDTAFNNFIGTVNNDLLHKVKPGFGALSAAQGDAFKLARERLKNSREQRVSNLKDNLSRRKVSGSSFAQDDITRSEAEFDTLDRELATAEGEAKAKAALAELDATVQLINQTYQAEISNIGMQLSTMNAAYAAEAQSKGLQLDDMNTILEVGANILNTAQTQFGQNARLEAQIAVNEANAQAAEASQFGGIIGGGIGMVVGGPAGAMIGSGLGSSLGGSFF